MEARMRVPPAALALLIALPATPLPAAAQTADEGPSLMERGAEMFLRGLMEEAEPALTEMERAFREIEPSLRAMGPALRDLVAMIEDIGNYDAPLRLPNGDILIRRKPGAPPLNPPAPAAPGEIEL
jgi:hypothetical protein